MIVLHEFVDDLLIFFSCTRYHSSDIHQVLLMCPGCDFQNALFQLGRFLIGTNELDKAFFDCLHLFQPCFHAPKLALIIGQTLVELVDFVGNQLPLFVSKNSILINSTINFPCPFLIMPSNLWTCSRLEVSNFSNATLTVTLQSFLKCSSATLSSSRATRSWRSLR